MKHSHLLEILYNSDIEDILQILNQSIYITNYSSPIETPIIIHTGFYFNSHRDKKIELLYDLNQEIVLRQVRNYGGELPLINGLLAGRRDGIYYNSFHKLVVIKIKKNNNLQGVFKYLKDPYTYLGKEKVTEITVIDPNDDTESVVNTFKIMEGNSVFKEIPLQKILSETLFFNGSTFSKY